MTLRIIFCSIAILHLTNSNAIKGNEGGPIVALRNPKGSLVQGHMLKSELGNDIWAYQDIPYAEPPIGERRFKLPVLSKGWTGVRQATETKQICLQPPMPFFHPPISNYTEDCLFLSVYSPTAPSSGKKYPVMIFVHGGRFAAGGGVFEKLHPYYFADEKIVMVTLNYRLGPLGLLSTGDEVIPSNLALHDQKLAFQWVHENIEAFGGNASNVVIAGQSAGAASIGWHLIGSKPSKYFTGAILASGTPLCPFAFDPNVYEIAVQFTQAIEPTFKPANSTMILEFLQKVSAQDIMKGWNNANHVMYGPTIQTGEDFCEPQTEAFDKGLTKRVPILVGFNSEEAIVLVDSVKNAEMQAAALDKSCKLTEKFNIKEEDREKACLSLKRMYTKGNFSDDIASYVRFQSDNEISRPVIRSVRSFSKYVSDTYLYQLAYKPSMMPKCPFKGVEGVGHSADLYLLFDQHDVASIMTKTDKLMSKRIVRIWSNFIKYRNPTPFPEALLENIKWPTVKPDEIWYLNLTTKLTVANNPKNCDTWTSAWDPFFQHPITVY